MNFAYRAGEINEYIINIRRHIHAHPELSFNEHKTTAYIADKLEEMGIEEGAPVVIGEFEFEYVY